MKKREIRIGIVGYGWVAGAHITSLHEIKDCRVRAICSRRKLDPNELSRKHGSEITVYNNYTDMLADSNIDIISICTPHHLHPEQAVQAAEAGKHLIIEKPVAIDLEGVNRIEKTVKKAGVKAMVCFEVKVIGYFKTVRDFINRGLLGDIHYAEVDYFHGIGPWYKQYTWNIKKSMGRSSLLTAGCHALDALIWIMGSKPHEVVSYATQSNHPDFRKYEYPTTSVTILKFENGSIGKCASVIDCIQPYLFNTHLVGSKGSVWNDKFYTVEFSGLDKTDWSRFHTQLVDSGDVAHHPYTALFSDFITAVREDRAPMFDFEESLFTHRVCLASDRSLKTGRPIKVKEFCR